MEIPAHIPAVTSKVISSKITFGIPLEIFAGIPVKK